MLGDVSCGRSGSSPETNLVLLCECWLLCCCRFRSGFFSQRVVKVSVANRNGALGKENFIGCSCRRSASVVVSPSLKPYAAGDDCRDVSLRWSLCEPPAGFQSSHQANYSCFKIPLTRSASAFSAL